jgi:lipid A 4'-phosphatase
MKRVAAFVAAFVLLCGPLVLFPAIDLAASGFFYTPDGGFYLGSWLPFRMLRAAIPLLLGGVVIFGIAVLTAGLRGRTLCGLDWRAGLFLLIALAVGPGLTVNSLFKDHWGRARPATITQFGGDKRFSPAFVPSDQCVRNCSFPAGDPAAGFYFVAAAFLVPPRRRRRAMAGAVALGALIGIVRIAQGGHFLSDVVASFFLVTAVSWLLHLWILRDDGLTRLVAQLRHPPRALRRFALGLVATAAAIWLSIEFLDRPLVDAFAGGNPSVQRVFRFITDFGVSTAYLVIAALAAGGFYGAARRTADAAQRKKFERVAWRAGFVFIAVAGAGLIGDILKPVFGRARPRLWVSDHIFGFTWHGARAAYWSFPSGHTITIVALGLTLAVIERRFWLLYGAAMVLVAASRVVLAEHYLSDVLAGAFLAATVVWAAQAGFARAGINVRDSL